MTLNQIQEIIKKNPTTQVYIKWITSSNSTQTARIFRPLKVHQDGSISLEAKVLIQCFTSIYMLIKWLCY